VWLPEKLEKNLDILVSNPEADLLYGASLYWYSWTGKSEDKERDYIWNSFGFEPNRIITHPELLIALLIVVKSIPGMNSFMFRRQIIEDVGGYEETFNFIYTDQAFYAKLFHVANVYITDGWWDKYRQHPDSSCQIAKKIGITDDIHSKFIEWLEEYLSKKSENRKEIWNAIYLKKKILRTEINANKWKRKLKKSNDEIEKLREKIKILNKELNKYNELNYLIYNFLKNLLDKTVKRISYIITFMKKKIRNLLFIEKG